MDRFKIDGHKLNYHTDRLDQWLRGENIYPIYMEISPTGSCNHRCAFCGLDFMGYKDRKLDTGLLKERLTEMGQLGLKSVMYGGEGEPLLHKDMEALALHTKTSGIDVALTTNAVPLTLARAEAIIPACEWIKVSLNAGTAKTYATIHKTSENDFERVFSNLAAAQKIRENTRARCALGVQIILLDENRNEVVTLAERVRGLGLDYLVVKPFSQHPQSEKKKYQNISYEENERLAERLHTLNTKNFSVVFRANAMQKTNKEKKPYRECLALPFWSYIDAGGGVWGCSVFLMDNRFYYGNIAQQSFQEIWEGERRKESLAWVKSGLDASGCRVNCRMDEVNLYLWELQTPPTHVNFI